MTVLRKIVLRRYVVSGIRVQMSQKFRHWKDLGIHWIGTVKTSLLRLSDALTIHRNGTRIARQATISSAYPTTPAIRPRFPHLRGLLGPLRRSRAGRTAAAVVVMSAPCAC